MVCRAFHVERSFTLLIEPGERSVYAECRLFTENDGDFQAGIEGPRIIRREPTEQRRSTPFSAGPGSSELVEPRAGFMAASAILSGAYRHPPPRSILRRHASHARALL